MPKVTLGEVAAESKETCKGDKSGYPVVGLEHITPGDITLTNWAENDESTFTKLFRKGDMLFGRRRAYLKKAAVAPFDGICSGDITVIRALPDKIVPELLPFIIQSEDFFDFAVGRSAGSLSPRVKWEYLKTYSFTLPSLEKQRELAEVLWAIEDTRTAYQHLEQATDELVKARFIEMFGDPVTNPMGWKTLSWKDVFDTTTGKIDSNAAIVGGEYPFFTCAKEPFEIDEYAFDCEALLLAGNNAAGIYDVKYYKGKFNAYQRTYVLQLKNTRWKYMMFKHQLEGRLNYLQSQSIGTNTKYLTLGILNRLQFIIPPIDLQNQFTAFVEQADKSKLAVQSMLEKTAAMKATVMREMFR